MLCLALMGLPGLAATPDPLDLCVQNLRRGPSSFRGYLCLGTPGLPERGDEVAHILDARLRAHPEDTHARLYRALMRLYALGPPPEREDFFGPVGRFREAGDLESLFFALLARTEYACIAGDGCESALDDVRDAATIAEASGNTDLRRLAAIAEMRYYSVASRPGDARRAEREHLDPLGGSPPAWLAVLELNTRTSVARSLGEHLRAWELSRTLAKASRRGTVGEAAAWANLSEMTTGLYFKGLVSRDEALETARRAYELQGAVGLTSYNSGSFGQRSARSNIAFIEGVTPAALASLEAEVWTSVFLEFLSLGDTAQRRTAATRAEKEIPVDAGPFSSAGKRKIAAIHLLVRSRLFLRGGRREMGRSEAMRAIELLKTDLRLEPNPWFRMLHEERWAASYHSVAGTVLDSTSTPGDDDISTSLEAIEGYRARTLLQALLGQRNDPGAGDRPETVGRVRAALRPGEALISFEEWEPAPRVEVPFTTGSSWAIAITRENAFAVRIPDPAAMEPAIRTWTSLVQQRDSQLALGSSQLYSALLEPVLKRLPPEVDQLIIVPDGPLHRLPFDALSPTGGEPFLAQRFLISVVPSAQIWLQLRERAQDRVGPAFALASGPGDSAVRHAVTRGEVDPDLLRPLAHARDEALEAVSAFGSGSRLLEDGEATTDALRSLDLRSPVLVHIATHAVVNEVHPEESFLLLAAGGRDSGKLRVADISSLHWDGKTIVLSACETSAGAVRLGEGVLSLARGFFAGGASAVVGTLAKVRDDEQYALIREFYSELRKGISVGEALSAAKRTLIARGAPPAAWANVVLLGDGAVRPHRPAGWTDGRSWRLEAFGGVALLACAALLLARRRQRGRVRPSLQSSE